MTNHQKSRSKKIKVFQTGKSFLPLMTNAQKKPVWVRASQIQEEFAVITKEGTMFGKKGDWLIEGVEGELYPCDKEIFKKTYNVGFECK